MSPTTTPSNAPHYQRYRDAIRRRWPGLAKRLEGVTEAAAQWVEDGPHGALTASAIHLSSGFDPQAEARLQARLIPEQSAEAWVYGVGSGELPKALLARDTLRRLHVVILNPALFLAILHHYPDHEWLEDPRVELTLADHERALNTPFCAVPPELFLAADGAAPLRDRIQLELDTLLINRRVNEEQDHSGHIEENLATVAADGDVSELFATRPAGAVSIAAAGPSLDFHYGFLALPQPIIAVDRALKLLLSRGITPEIVVSIDPHPLVTDYLDIPAEQAASITLVYSPTIPPEAVARWPGRRLAAYGESALFDEAAARLPRGRLHQAGSVIHPAVDLAIQMGARHLLLFGADFSFPYNKRHANGSMVAGPPEAVESGAWVHDWEGKRVPTLPNLRGYLRDFEDFIARHPQARFYSFGAKGARIAGSHLIRSTS
ncbi:motility associated factor glycosyltransferase family protein [Endothiovibrio diazotrophicus]